MLEEASFQDPADFPETTFMVTPLGSSGPVGDLDFVNAFAKMWSEILAEDILCEQDPAVIPLFFYGDPDNE